MIREKTNNKKGGGFAWLAKTEVCYRFVLQCYVARVPKNASIWLSQAVLSFSNMM